MLNNRRWGRVSFQIRSASELVYEIRFQRSIFSDRKFHRESAFA